MSDFITTMATRASGEIPTVEPLISSMFLSLPPMSSDYTEDMFAEPEPPESWEDDPDLSFLPLLNYDPWSVEIPNWYENEDFEVEEIEGENSPQNLPEKLATKNISDSNPNTEIKIIESEVILGEENRGWQSQEEVSNHSATPQGNSLDTASVSAEASGELNPLVSKTESESPQVFDNNQLNISRKLTHVENKEISSPSTEDTQSTITPQVNGLEAASPSLQADINSNPSISNTQSELTKVSEKNQDTRRSSTDETSPNITIQANVDLNPPISNTQSESAIPSDKNQAKTNQQLNNLDNQDTHTFSTDEVHTTLTTQVSRLETTSPSLQANINSNLSISNTESGLTAPSDNNSSAIKPKVNQLESAEYNSDLTKISDNNLLGTTEKPTNLKHQETNTSSSDGTLAKTTPVINRLELASPSVQAKTEADSSVSHTEFDSNLISDDSQVNTQSSLKQNHQISNTNQVKTNSQLTNLVNEDTYTSSQEEKLSKITPQVNRLESKSIPAQSSLDSHLSISNTESNLNQGSDDNSLNTHKEVTDLDNGEVHTSSQNDTSPTITPQVNRLETASSSLQANVESNPSILNTELELTKIFDDNQATTSSKVTGSENREINSSAIKDTASSAITPQINRLGKVSKSVKANVESHSPVINTNYDLIQSSDNSQEKANQESTNIENREAYTSFQEEKQASTTKTQINQLDEKSRLVQANVELNLLILNTESELAQKSDDHQAITSTKETELNSREILISSINEISSTITPQINRLETASQSVKANVESHLSIANQDYDVIQKSDESQAKVNQKSTNIENRKAYEHDRENKTSTEAQFQSNVPTSTTNSSSLEQKKLTENLETGKHNKFSINEISSTVVPQVSRLAEKLPTHTNEKISRGKIESNQNEQVNKIGKQQKVNPGSASSSEYNSVSNNHNSSLIYPLRQLGKLINRGSRKQKQIHSDLTRKNLGEKTVTPNLQNHSAPLVTSQESSNLQEQRLSHINQVNPGKESVKAELKSDASYSLQNTTSSDNAKSKNNAQQSNSPRIQRSPLNSPSISQSSQSNQFKHREENKTKSPKEKITPQQKVEARLDQSVNSLSSSTSTSLNGEHSLRDTKKLQPPVSEVSQSSNYSQQNYVLSNPHNAKLNLNTVKNAPNAKHISKNESKLNSNYSSIKPNINESISVITNQENYPNLSSPKSSKISPVNNQTEPRQNQSKSPSSPTIQITIGSIEVRGTQSLPSPKSTTRKSTKRNPSLSLQDYLKQRDGK